MKRFEMNQNQRSALPRNSIAGERIGGGRRRARPTGRGRADRHDQRTENRVHDLLVGEDLRIVAKRRREQSRAAARQGCSVCVLKRRRDHPVEGKHARTGTPTTRPKRVQERADAASATTSVDLPVEDADVDPRRARWSARAAAAPAPRRAHVEHPEADALDIDRDQFGRRAGAAASHGEDHVEQLEYVGRAQDQHRGQARQR